ncbi:MAG: hypothetical protein ACO2ON_03845 [Candidatus Nanopusillus sp.]
MATRRFWNVRFSDEATAEYIEKEIQKIAIELKENLEELRGKIYKAIVYDLEIKAKVIEYIKKNG